MSGEMIGSYRIVRKLGQGGMGTVFEAVDTMLEREVALKVLRSEFAGETELAERFRTEAIILARLNHANIATLYGLVREGSQLFMVMEFVRGDTLERRVRREGRVAPALAAAWACQALDAMAYAHRQGVVHRDIKPANLMVTEDDTIKVMDFGIARVLGTAHQTRFGHVIGTASYMAPEQIRGQDVDGRADIYALGIVLYQLVTGVPPFQGTDEFAVMTAQINDPPPPLSTLAGSLPGWLETAILRALQKDPAARFQDAASFRRALRQGLGLTDSAGLPAIADRGTGSTTMLPPPAELPTMVTPTSRLAPEVTTRRSSGPRRRMPLYVAGGAALAIAVAAGAFAWISMKGGGAARAGEPGQVPVSQAVAGQPAASQPAPGAGNQGSAAVAPVVSAQKKAVTGDRQPGVRQAAGAPAGARAAEAGNVPASPIAAQPLSPPPPAPAVSSDHPAPEPAASAPKPADNSKKGDEPAEPESFDVMWLRDNELTGMSMNLYPDHLTLADRDEVAKSVRYAAVAGISYAESRKAAPDAPGIVRRLFGGGKHWLTFDTGDGQIVLRVGRAYKDIVPVLEKLTGKKVKTTK